MEGNVRAGDRQKLVSRPGRWDLQALTKVYY